MQCNTGNIHQYTQEQFEELDADLKRQLAPIGEADVSKVKRMAKPRRKNWMRNKPCPCESGKKFKKCCWNKYL